MPNTNSYDLKVENISPKKDEINYFFPIFSHEKSKIVQLIAGFQYKFTLYQKNSKKIVKIWQEDFTNIKIDTVVEKEQ